MSQVIDAVKYKLLLLKKKKRKKKKGAVSERPCFCIQFVYEARRLFIAAHAMQNSRTLFTQALSFGSTCTKKQKQKKGSEDSKIVFYGFVINNSLKILGQILIKN